MKWVFVPIFKLVWWAIVVTFYYFVKIFNLCWSFSINPNLKSDILDVVANDQYYYFTRRYFHDSDKFSSEGVFRNQNVVPKSFIQWLKWLILYDGHVEEMTEKEELAYKEYCKQKLKNHD